MSNYSSFSSASRMEIDRLNEVAAIKDARAAAEAEKTAAEMAEKDKKLAALQAMLMASGILGATAVSEPRGPLSVKRSDCQNTNTPSRKRHSSQQLGGIPKDSRFSINRFEVLMDAEMDRDFENLQHEDISTQIPSTSAQQDLQNLAQTQSRLQYRAPVQNVASFSSQGVLDGQIEPIFEVRNVAHMRQEVEIAFEKLNGEPFRGSITLQEAKHQIFKHCLGFGDFSNFDGARPGFRGSPVVVFKLKTAINVDELLPLQHFTFRRVTSRQGSSHVDNISCKIRGLRKQSFNSSPASHNRNGNTGSNQTDDGTRTVKVEGCEYRIPKNTLLEFISLYGEIKSAITEDLFEDGSNPDTETDGTNRTGTYSVKVKLARPIPQLLPILGRRIKIYYPGIQKLCTNCFGNHPKRVCHSRKVLWPDYVKSFMIKNPEMPARLFGKWHDGSRQSNETKNIGEQLSNTTELNTGPRVNTLTKQVQHPTIPATKPIQTPEQTVLSPNQARLRISDTATQGPEAASFKVPANPVEHDQMVEKMMQGGLLRSEAEQSISARKTAFNKACKEFKKSENSQLKGLRKATKNRRSVNPISNESCQK